MCYTPRIAPFVLYSVNPVLSLRNLETGVYKTESKGVFECLSCFGSALKLLIMEHVSWKFLDKFTDKLNTNTQDTILV